MRRTQPPFLTILEAGGRGCESGMWVALEAAKGNTTYCLNPRASRKEGGPADTGFVQ